MAISNEEMKAIIVQGNTKLMVKKTEEFGKYLAQDLREEKIYKLSTSQIRSIFGTVKKIEAKGYDAKGARELLMLKPKLAYAAKRAGKNKLADLRDVLTMAIDIVVDGLGNEAEKFDHFCDLFESILCYHKASGGN